VQSARRRQLRHLHRNLLCLFESGLLLRQQRDEVLLAAQRADLVLGELGLERLAAEVAVGDARLRGIEQFDEVRLGARDGDAVLFGKRLKLLDGESVEIADGATLEGRLEFGVLFRLGVREFLQRLRWQNARGGFVVRLGHGRDAADVQRPC